eukprot:TCONS_00018257-protein
MKFKLMYISFAFILLVFTKQIFASNIIRRTSSNEGTFQIRRRGKRIATTPYKTFEVPELFDCADACVYDTPCKSINVNKNSSPWICELVSDDRNTKDEYVDAPGVDHYDTGWTSISIITNYDNNMCLVSKYYRCNLPTDSVWEHIVVETDMTVCNENPAALFHFDRDTGRLVHHCSGYQVCPLHPFGSTSWVGIVKTGCNWYQDINDYFHTWRRNFLGYLYSNNLCPHFQFWDWAQGKPLMLYHCEHWEPRRVMKFPSIPHGPVYVQVVMGLSYSKNWDEYINHPKFTGAQAPDFVGHQDDFFTASGSWTEGYGMRFEAIFVAPSTGDYKFRIYCDDICMFNMGTSPQTKTTIIDYRTPDMTPNYLAFT